jgi:hypothetical protein
VNRGARLDEEGQREVAPPEVASSVVEPVLRTVPVEVEGLVA